MDAEKRAITVANAERFVKEMEEKFAGERKPPRPMLLIAEQKVAKTRYDLEDTAGALWLR